MSQDAIDKISGEVRTYIEHIWPRLERRGGFPDTPMNRKAKGESNPPLGDFALEVIERNAVASKYLRFFLEQLEASDRRSKGGIFFSRVLKDARYDPSLLTTWYDRDSLEYPLMKDALKEIQRTVAKGVIFVYGAGAAAQINVIVSPRDEQARQRTREAQKKETERIDMQILDRLEDLEERGYGREEAKRHIARDKTNDWSYRRVERAITGENERGAA